MSLNTFFQRQPSAQYFSNAPVSIYCAKFSIEKYNDLFFADLDIHFPDNIRKAVAKRKSEYLAGRYLAKLALADKGINNFKLLSDDNRCPLWPNGITGSISHTQNIAFCVLANNANSKGLGVDVEYWIKKQSESLIQDSIIDDSEKHLIENSALPFNQGFTLVFSAKESLFKALYPQIGRYFGFSSAKLTRIDLNKATIHFELAENLSPNVPKKTTYALSFALYETHVLTLLVLE